MNRGGRAGEASAVNFLLSHGHRIIERNFACRYGEIDIISYDGAVVFSEVKMRSGYAYGGASAAVTKTKQQKILKTARLYLQQNPEQALCACRFDVIAIEQGYRSLTITWIKSAFIDS
ncbi:MAG: YraN family protein [Luminiphilus sp.]|nr:YraN family protein [Luminiphilus sp.]